MEQADAYEDEDDLFSRQARFWSELSLTHPVAVRRVKELTAWVRSGEFDLITGGEYVQRGDESPPSAEFDAAVTHYGDRFAGVLERTAGGVQGLGKQFGDWLKRFQGERHSPRGGIRNALSRFGHLDLIGVAPAGLRWLVVARSRESHQAL